LAFLNTIWDLFLELDHDTETTNGRKKHSLHSKHFRAKIGASTKKVHPPQFLRGKKGKKCFQPAENPTETLVMKAKKPKKQDVERTTGWCV